MAETWAFTIKYNPNCVTEDQLREKYSDIIKHWLKNKVQIEMYRLEDMDKKGQRTKLHVHGKCIISKGIYRKKLQLPNYHIKLVLWRDSGWEQYTAKNIERPKILGHGSGHIMEPSGIRNKGDGSDYTDSGDDNIECVIPQRKLFSRPYIEA